MGNVEEILEMEPGEELDQLVAEEVMGHLIVNDATFGAMERLLMDGEAVWGTISEYSQDMSVAEQVVLKLVELGVDDVTCYADASEGKYTQAEAICKNALLTIRDRRQNGNN